MTVQQFSQRIEHLLQEAGVQPLVRLTVCSEIVLMLPEVTAHYYSLTRRDEQEPKAEAVS